MTRKSLANLLFVLSCLLTSAAFAHQNLDAISEAIENERFATVEKLALRFDAKAVLRTEQLVRLRQALKDASREMLEHVENLGSSFLPEEVKEQAAALKNKSDAAQHDPSLFQSLAGEVSALVNELSHDPKVWFLLLLSNAQAFAQNSTGDDPAFISQSDWNNVVYWTHVSFALNWTTVAVLIIAPVAFGIIKCCCGKA
ncbi:MAG TPA: hypothetical protein VEL47_04935 [Myxococcota bacterium]|nr:hypothetical protein [Myxococcota bacterium]